MRIDFITTGLRAVMAIAVLLAWAPKLGAQEPKPLRSIETEIVALTPSGFIPSEISRPAGPFLLVIQNRTRLPEVNVQLARTSASGKLKDVKLPKDKHLRDVLDLSTGEYRFTEAADPRYVLKITITK